MTRTALGLSFSVVLVLGSAIACGSSKSTDDTGGSAGNGSILTGGSGGGPSNSGGTANSAAGASSGGTRAGGGATGTAGASAGGKCADDTVTCVDATHASGCNLDTGVVETFDCVAELNAIGIVSSGCTKDATNGDSCAVDSFADAACVDGTKWLSYCDHATSDQALNVYISCFTNFMDGHTIIPCYSQYVSDTMKTDGDCANAESACFGVGAGGASGSP